MILRFLTSTALICSLAACVTKPPLEACSAEWLTYQADLINTDIRKEFSGELKRFRRLANALENPSPVNSIWMTMAMTNLPDDVERIANEFIDNFQPRFETIADTCDSPELMANALEDLLREEGAPDAVFEFLDLYLTLKDDTALNSSL